MDNHFRVAGSSDAQDAANQAFAAHKQDGPQIVDPGLAGSDGDGRRLGGGGGGATAAADPTSAR